MVLLGIVPRVLAIGDGMQFWSSVEAYLERGERVVVVLVVQNSKHSPGTQGARMFLTESNMQFGTIGGGIMELEICERFSELAHMQSPLLEVLHHSKNATGKQSGMICAGKQTNLYLPLDTRHLHHVSDLAALELEDKPGEFVVSHDGTWRVIQGTPASVVPTLQDGPFWTYREPVFEWKRAAIFGGGHCGLALSDTLARLGYVVTVIDTREDLQTLQDNTSARYIEVVDDYEQGARRIRYPKFNHVVVMTADFAGDTAALLGVSKIKFPYVGLMGSSAKIRAIFRTLKERGVGDEFLEALYAPLGLAMKSDRPEEIAISVAAQFLQLRESLVEWTQWPDAD